ncbi:MAG: two-component regulator propeller domain-containing protein [Blastocatellales bacterium]
MFRQDTRPRKTGCGWRRYCAWACGALVCALAAASASAQYRFDSWTTEHGLPQNSVYAILQTRDGYLWFTTLDGLVRYNGAQFTVFNKTNTSGFASLRFNSLCEDRDGNLWIGSEDGALTRYRAGSFTTFTTEHGLPHNYVGRIWQTADGVLVAQTPKGLARFQNEGFEAVSPDPNGFATDTGYRGVSGAVWYRRETELRRVSNGRLSAYQVPAGDPNQLYEDRQGRLWIGTARPGVLAMLKDEAVRIYTVKDGLPLALVTSFCEDRAGALWFGTRGGGLARFKDDRFTIFTTAQGLSSNVIRAIYEDREGILWLGTADNGLMRLTPQIITHYSEKDGMVGKGFYPILEDRAGAIWIANEGVNRLKDGKFTYYSLNRLPRQPAPRQPFVIVRSLYEDRAGRLLLGGDAGLIRFKDERFSYDKAAELSRTPLAIFQDRQGAFWFGFNDELLREQNGARQSFGVEDGLRGQVQPIYEDRKGRVWIGGYGGLAEYVDGRLRMYTERDGLSSNRVRAIYEDDDGALWIGTYDGGLNRFKDGRFTRFTAKEGMFSNNVFSILEDRRGNFWMGGNQGIHRVSRRQLNDFAEGKITRIDAIAYGKADGMLSAECNGGRNPAALKARDGRLWFPTLNGVAVVDPEAVSFNAAPPPVVIESVTLDRAALDFHQPVTIHPGQDNLEIAYAGLSFIKPEHVRFKYRLEGLDRDWVEANNRRVAYFSHPPPGSYTFHVIAANSDGVWNNEGARLRVVVLPAFYQTWWFRLALLLAIAGGVGLAFKHRLDQAHRARRAQEEFSRRLIDSQEQERKRIAAELHDSLGQNLLLIKNHALLGLAEREDHAATEQNLTTISEITSQVLDEARQIAYNLRPYQIDRFGLTKAIQSMLDRVAEASEIRFHYEVDSLDGLFSKEAEMNLYRIVQESVNNILKHSRATEAEIKITRNGRSLLLRVADNGQGFAPEAGAETARRGFGLTGIAERARMLGGQYQLQSTPGRGAVITISAALPDTPHE